MCDCSEMTTLPSAGRTLQHSFSACKQSVKCYCKPSKFVSMLEEHQHTDFMVFPAPTFPQLMSPHPHLQHCPLPTHRSITLNTHQPVTSTLKPNDGPITSHRTRPRDLALQSPPCPASNHTMEPSNLLPLVTTPTFLLFLVHPIHSTSTSSSTSLHHRAQRRHSRLPPGLDARQPHGQCSPESSA